MINEYNIEKENLLKLLNDIENNKQDWNGFHTFIELLIHRKNWRRRDLYGLLWDIMNKNNYLNENTIDEVAEFETTITGYCDPTFILRFPDDPTDLNDLTCLVRSNHWKEQC